MLFDERNLIGLTVYKRYLKFFYAQAYSENINRRKSGKTYD
jgi:hypothetical protein